MAKRKTPQSVIFSMWKGSVIVSQSHYHESYILLLNYHNHIKSWMVTTRGVYLIIKIIFRLIFIVTDHMIKKKTSKNPLHLTL